MDHRLTQYLRNAAYRRYELGVSDCIVFAADWVLVRCGIDPLAPYRGYRGTAEANALLAGGLPRVVGRAARSVGLRLTRSPKPGDIGVVALGNLAVCAIRTERGWALRLDDGLASLPAERVRVIAAWSV